MKWRILFVLAVSLLVAACASTTDVDLRSETQAMPPTMQDLMGYEWVLNGAASNPAIDPAFTVTLSVGTQGDSIVGYGPCNTYRAGLSVDQQTLKISAVTSTNKACDEATMQAEHSYFIALQSVTSEQRHDNQLTLQGPNGVKLVYSLFDLKTALVGSWNITGYATPNAVVSPVTGTQPLLTLNGNDHFNLQTGCNTLNGLWKLEGNLFDAYHFNSLKHPPNVPSPCSAEVIAQESQLVAALKAATSVQVVGHSMSLFNPPGTIAMTGTPAS